MGQRLFSLNKPETEVGTGHPNDPLNTCDPLGIPRNTVFETRGIVFGTMGRDRIVVLHQYQRIWRYVWMDGKHELPKSIDTKDEVPARWYGYGHQCVHTFNRRKAKTLVPDEIEEARKRCSK